jgi:hypothetical protein
MPKTNGSMPPFIGFSSPNGTIVPDEVFDILMPQLSEAELRVLLYIIRRTFGFKKDSDNISLRQMVEGITTKDGRRLDSGAGVSKSTAVRAAKGLLAKGVIVKQNNRSTERGDEATSYGLRFYAPPVFHGRTPPPVSPQNTPVFHRETHNKQVEQQTDGKTFRKAHAKKFDGETETTETPANASATAQTVSHSIHELTPDQTGTGETPNDPATAAVVPADASDTAAQTSEPPPARTRALTESVTPETHSQTSAETETEGFQRLREQAVRIREEVRQRKEREAAAADGNTARPYVSARSRGRPPGSREDREHIAAYLQDFQPELGDEAPLSSSVSRALNIFRTAHIPPDRWADCLYQARSITKERTAQITKKPGEHSSGFAAKNRAPYFFAVLESLSGLRQQAPSTLPGTP